MFDHEIGAMKQSPNDKGPGGAVTETAQEHNDDEIDRGSRPSHPVAAERNVKVIAQKRGKRNVPASPEIGKADRGVGKTEIIFQMETEAQRRADRAGGIAGEIEKYLTSESDDA